MAAKIAPMKMKLRKGCRLRRSISLKLGKRQVLTMRNEMATISAPQASERLHQVAGWPRVKWTTAATTPAAPGMGMPRKYLLPGRPGLEGCGFLVMLKRARRLAPAVRKIKLAMMPSCTSFTRRSLVSKLIQEG